MQRVFKNSNITDRQQIVYDPVRSHCETDFYNKIKLEVHRFTQRKFRFALSKE